MANLQHDNDGFLSGDSVNLDNQTNLLESISKDIAAIRSLLSNGTVGSIQGTQVQDAVVATPSNNSSESTVVNNHAPPVTPTPPHQSESAQRETTPIDTPTPSIDRVILATLEPAIQTLGDIQIDLSSTANSLETASNNQQSNEVNHNAEPRQAQTETTSNIGTNNNPIVNGNNGNVAQPVVQSNRIRDENGRFVGGNQGGKNGTVSEPKTKNGRDANGRFSGGEGGGLGKGHGGEAGFISRLASGIGGVVGDSSEIVDEKIDPFIGAMKEIAEPISKVGGMVLGAGKGIFNGAKSVVNFLPKFKKKDGENTENNATASNANQTTSNLNAVNPSPATREVRTPPSRINETTTANPTLRARDSRGRFVSNNPVVETSTRQSDNPLIQNNAPPRRTIEPSRNDILGENPSIQSTENTQQTAQSEPPVVGTSRRGFFGMGGNSSNKEKGGKLSLSRAIKEILSSRKEQSIYNKASLKLLRAIAGKETTVSGGGDSGGGFLGGLMGGLIPMVVAGLGA
ncbi:MAG: hypothetical protein WCL34_09925, partial [Methylococcaceae bacterium]